MLLLLLPGTPTTYQGEELGMEGIHLMYEQTQDPYGKNAGPVSFVPNNMNNDANIYMIYRSQVVNVYEVCLPNLYLDLYV